MSIVQRAALITGAAQGIGRRTAEHLAGLGYALLLTDLNAPQATAESIARHGVPVETSAGDLTDEVFVERLVQRARERFGQLDVLINNAGISSIAPAESVSTSQFRRVLEVNLVAPFMLARGVGALMLARGAGSIVNVASVAGLLGIADRSAYNASKHGLIGLTRTLAAEWGGRGVRVNAEIG